MKFTFHIRNAAVNNSPPARLREATRMACVAHALDQLGHEVWFGSVPHLLRDSPRWEYFKHIPVGTVPGSLMVMPAESIVHGLRADVAFKTSVSVQHDADYARRCGLLVAHECAVPDAENVLNVPFLIHDRVMADLIELDLFDAYLRDNVDRIRDEIPRRCYGFMGFCGARFKHRAEFLRDAPDWLEARIYDTHPMGGWEHACWLSGFRAALCLPGDTPKTNLPPLCALLGIPIVAPEPEHNTPPLDDASMIWFEGWEHTRAILDDVRLLNLYAEEATEVYRLGWSPLGIARQIVGRFE